MPLAVWIIVEVWSPFANVSAPMFFLAIQAAIGQSDNKFTPVQMVCYTSALANGGVRYKATFLSRVVSWDYQALIKEHMPTVASELDISDEALDCVHTGMELVATKGTAAQYLANYPIKVACKTGTAQWGNEHSGSDHASYRGQCARQSKNFGFWKDLSMKEIRKDPAILIKKLDEALK